MERDGNLSVPVIDLGGLRSGDPAEREKIARELGAAAEKWGFFQVVNHGIEDELQDRIYEQTRQFFDLPLDIKKGAEIADPNPRLFGYKGFEGPHEPGEGREESIFIKEALADPFSPSTSLEDLAAKIWPGGSSTFTNTLQEHCHSVRSLGKQILELLAESLGLQRDVFSRHFNDTAEDSCTWRLHHFPPNPLPATVLRTPPHTDPSVLTLLKQDVCGLQVIKPADPSNWVNVETLPGSYIVNVGNILEAWSNGRFCSGEHQVVLDKYTERFSIVLFLEAGPTLYIETPPELVHSDRASQFVPFFARDFRVNFDKIKKLGDLRNGQALNYFRRPSP